MQMETVNIYDIMPFYLRPEFLTIVANVVIALATIVNLYVSFRMGRANSRSALAAEESSKIARQSVELTRQAFEAANRPYLEIGDQVFESEVQHPHISFELVNYGPVPLSLLQGSILAKIAGSDTHFAEIPGGETVAHDGRVWIQCPVNGVELLKLQNHSDPKLRLSATFRYVSMATNCEYALEREYEYSIKGLRDMRKLPMATKRDIPASVLDLGDLRK